MKELTEALYQLTILLRELLPELPSNAAAIKRRQQGLQAAQEDANMPESQRDEELR
jgi:hypothetical protein